MRRKEERKKKQPHYRCNHFSSIFFYNVSNCEHTFVFFTKQNEKKKRMLGERASDDTSRKKRGVLARARR